MTPEQAIAALNAFKALRADVEQFDVEGASSLFSEGVPLPMKSYLVNWLRRFTADHGDQVQAALEAVTIERCEHGHCVLNGPNVEGGDCVCDGKPHSNRI